MDFKKKVFILSILFLLFLISGCSEQTHNFSGVVFDEVYISPEKAYGGEDVEISLLLKNIGNVPADDIELSLKGDGFSSPENIHIDYLEGETKGQISANKNSVEWNVVAENNNNLFDDLKYSPSIKACYHYQTKAIIKIKSMPLDEYRILQRRGKIPDKYLHIIQTKGPLQMKISANPIFIKKEGKEEKIKLNIGFINTGFKYGGSIYNNNASCSEKNINKANVTVLLTGTKSVNTGIIDFLRDSATYRVEFDAP